MKFTLLLCTLNRAEMLKRCVISLLNQSYDDYQIIIVDQSDKINHEYDSYEKIQYIHISEKGISHSRNVGLKSAKGEYICLIDDDAEYDPNYLKSAKELLDESSFSIICGKVIDPEDGTYYLPKLSTNHRVSINYSSAFSYCVSASMVIERNLLGVEGFDERFGVGAYYGAGEETDIVFRALEQKKSIEFCPKMMLYHKAPTSGYDRDKLYKYSLGIGAMYKKHLLLSNNIRYIGLYIKSLMRSVVGSALYFCGSKKNKKSIPILKGKIDGFIRFRG